MDKKRDLLNSGSNFGGADKGMGYRPLPPTIARPEHRAEIADTYFTDSKMLRDGERQRYRGDDMLIHYNAEGGPRFVGMDEQVNIASGNEKFIRVPRVHLPHIPHQRHPGPLTIAKAKCEFIEHQTHGRLGMVMLLDETGEIVGDRMVPYPSPGEALAVEMMTNEVLALQRAGHPGVSPQSDAEWIEVMMDAAQDAWRRADKLPPDMADLVTFRGRDFGALTGTPSPSDPMQRVAHLIPLFIERVAG